jgi:hypothetical protein
MNKEFLVFPLLLKIIGLTFLPHIQLKALKVTKAWNLRQVAAA